MIKNVLQDIGGIGLYGVISVCLFFTIFTSAFLWALCQKKSFCAEMSALPLESDSEPEQKLERSASSSHEK